MLQKEFEELTGMQVSAEEYRNAERAYEDCPFDKQTFCKDYKKHSDSTIIPALCNKINDLRTLHASIKEIYEEEIAQLKKDHEDEVAVLTSARDTNKELYGIASRQLEEAEKKVVMFTNIVNAIKNAKDANFEFSFQKEELLNSLNAVLVALV